MVVGERGVALSLKQEPKLCHVRPTVDLATETLTLSAAGVRAWTVNCQLQWNLAPSKIQGICPL